MTAFRRAQITTAASRGVPVPVKAVAGTFSIVRMVALFAVLGLLPLAVLTYVSTHLAEQAVVREVNAKVSATSAVTAALVQHQMQAVASLTQSYASRPLMVAALGDGNAAHYQAGDIATHLAQLKATAPVIGGVFLADMGCRVRHVDPASPGVVGADFSFRDWCRG